MDKRRKTKETKHICLKWIKRGEFVKYAIDRLKVGSEEEVSAEQFENMYIPHKHTRFVCPECGEPTFWRSKGGSQPSKFCHYGKTDTSPECDARVDGKSELYLYERVGLPIALICTNQNRFRLCMLFPAVGEKRMEACIHNNTKITIAGGREKLTYCVNHTYFQANRTSLIPIQFIPPTKEKYIVQIENGNDIKKKWSNYSDGFINDMGIFAYGENGGKKIRQGDCVSPGKRYYVIAKQFDSLYPELEVEQVGSVFLNNTTFFIYTILTTVSVFNEDRFQIINDFFMRRFGVLLLEPAPTIIPLWPPVTEQDGLIPIKQATTTIYCAVSSGNFLPKVYQYKQNEVQQLRVYQHNVGVSDVKINLDSEETIVSVDRKYVGREIAFQKKSFVYPNAYYEHQLQQKNGDSIEWNILRPYQLSSALILKSNAKVEFYVGNREKNYQHMAIRDESTQLSALQNAQEIIFVVEKNIIQHYIIQSMQELACDEQGFIEQIKKSCFGQYVDMPRWMHYMLIKWKKAGNFYLVETIRSKMIHNQIPLGLVYMIKKTVYQTEK